MKGPVIHIFCIRELGYSEASAHRRIGACRLLKDIPEIEKKIENGSLSLTNISQVNQMLKGSDLETKKEALKKVEGLTKKECEMKLFEITGTVKKGKESKQRLSHTQTKVSIVLSNESIELMDKVKKLIGKEISSDELIQIMAKAALEKIEKEKFKITKNPRNSLPLAKVGRMIPAKVKREVYLRDKKCTNCGTTHNLNFDHRIAFSMGGTSTMENIRMLCFQCNQRGRIRMRL